MKQNKRGQGITIISLVITIVILLILAGVALSISVNEEGLFSKSDTAKKNYLKAQDKESIEFIVMNVMLNNNGIKTFSNMYNAFMEDKNNNGTVSEIIEPESSENETTEIKGKTKNNYIFVYDVQTGKVTILDNLDNLIVTYDLNGGEFLDATQIETEFSNLEYGSTHNIISNIPTQTNKKFEGWKIENSDDLYNSGDTITVKNNIVLVAQYSQEKYGLVSILKDCNYSNIVSTDAIELTSETALESITAEVETGPVEEKINYEMRIYRFPNDITITSGQTIQLGDPDDVATSTDEAKRMVVAIFEGNLTVEQEATLTAIASTSGYGGPKGMFICVKGELQNNGIITMTARGAKATGENVYLYSSNSTQWEFVPKDGATAGTARTMNTATSSWSIKGIPGNPGEGRQTGGGGQGGMRKTNNATTQKVKGGIGTAGTSYSGGSGGGGATLNNTDVNFDGGAGTANGGAGGKGVVKYSGSAGSIAAGGAGNPGGNYGLTGQDTNNATTLSKIKGRSGTGGLLIIYGDKVLNNGTISSNGSARRRSRYRYCKNYNRNC